MGARSSHPRSPNLNKTDGHLIEYFRENFGGGGGADSGPKSLPSGIDASGGIVSDWVDGGNYYRTHVFTTSGSLVVNSLSTDPNLPDNAEYVVIGGGGGGGHNVGGGGGAGGMRHNTPLLPEPTRAPTYELSAGTYTVTIGAGGGGASANNVSPPTDLVFGKGGDSNFFPTSHNSYPATQYIRGAGGGGQLAAPGGSGSGTQ